MERRGRSRRYFCVLSSECAVAAKSWGVGVLRFGLDWSGTSMTDDVVGSSTSALCMSEGPTRGKVKPSETYRSRTFRYSRAGLRMHYAPSERSASIARRTPKTCRESG